MRFEGSTVEKREEEKEKIRESSELAVAISAAAAPVLSYAVGLTQSERKTLRREFRMFWQRRKRSQQTTRRTSCRLISLLFSHRSIKNHQRRRDKRERVVEDNTTHTRSKSFLFFSISLFSCFVVSFCLFFFSPVF